RLAHLLRRRTITQRIDDSRCLALGQLVELLAGLFLDELDKLLRLQLCLSRLVLDHALLGAGRQRVRGLLLLAVGAGERYRSISDRAGVVEVVAELRAVADSGERSPDRLGLGLLDVILKRVDRLAAPTGGGTTVWNLDEGAKNCTPVLMRMQFGGQDGIGMLGTEPRNAPLNLEIVL